MLASDIISITDFRNRMNKIFASLSRPQFIVANNKPQAVIMSVAQYESMMKKLEWEDVVDFGHNGIDPQDLLSSHNRR